MRSARLVAESLRVMPVPVAHELPPARLLAPDAMQAAWAAAHQPSRCDDPPPAWLRPTQVDSWQRAVAAIEGWHGAVLAEPVGSGKSWIALAVAQRFARTILVIGPAALAAQWHHTAIRAGIPIHWHSHEKLSRGAQPHARGAFVIVDEAHRFRHLHTRRARVLAPWLVGHRTLLLTATPIINRRFDLIALLQLLVADDALSLDGIGSLRKCEEAAHPPAALSRLVIRSIAPHHAVPLRESVLAPDVAGTARGRAAIEAVDALALADDTGVRRLLATVLLDAAASSDAAWRAALQRYRALLLQSRDAGGLARATLRQFAGPALDQLVLWPLLGELEVLGAPPQRDLQLVEALLDRPAPAEGWMDQVARTIADGIPTICFARHRATAVGLVRHLGDRTAWVTGAASGIGPHRLGREQILAAFGPEREQWRVLQCRPSCLVCTEVLAEGLDLQGARRVIHLDLPWHPARLEQRNGRVRRVGQLAPDVEVVTRRPAAAIERALGLGRRIRHKARLADRWLGRITVARTAMTCPPDGVWYATAASTRQAEALAIVLLRAEGRMGAIGLELHEGAWHAAAGDLLPHFEPTPAGELTRFERSRCTRLARRAAWRALELSRVAAISRPRLVSRLLGLAHDARTRRDHGALEKLDQLLGAAGRTAPLGLEQWLATLADATDRELLDAPVSPLPNRPRPIPITVLLMLFRSGETPLR